MAQTLRLPAVAAMPTETTKQLIRLANETLSPDHGAGLLQAAEIGVVDAELDVASRALPFDEWMKVADLAKKKKEHYADLTFLHQYAEHSTHLAADTATNAMRVSHALRFEKHMSTWLHCDLRDKLKCLARQRDEVRNCREVIAILRGDSDRTRRTIYDLKSELSSQKHAANVYAHRVRELRRAVQVENLGYAEHAETARKFGEEVEACEAVVAAKRSTLQAIRFDLADTAYDARAYLCRQAKELLEFRALGGTDHQHGVIQGAIGRRLAELHEYQRLEESSWNQLC